LQGLRKPAAQSYEVLLDSLQVSAGEVIFVDDRKPNVEAAAVAGIDAILFLGSDDLRQQLQRRGIAV
jgi:HAD superfamily hydrolase (TIGR01509 family)